MVAVAVVVLAPEAPLCVGSQLHYHVKINLLFTTSACAVSLFLLAQKSQTCSLHSSYFAWPSCDKLKASL